jgi:hypothetical protein
MIKLSMYPANSIVKLFVKELSKRLFLKKNLPKLKTKYSSKDDRFDLKRILNSLAKLVSYSLPYCTLHLSLSFFFFFSLFFKIHTKSPKHTLKIQKVQLKLNKIFILKNKTKYPFILFYLA